MRCWLVEREYDDKGLVRLVYATPDGSRRLVSERAATTLREAGVTAAREVDPETLDDADDPALGERYAAEVERVRAGYGPDDPI